MPPFSGTFAAERDVRLGGRVTLDRNGLGTGGAACARSRARVRRGSLVGRDALVDAARLDERVGRLRLVLKDAKLADIIEAIRGAAAGESLIAPRLAGSLLARLRRHDPRDESPAPVEPRLTEREREVLSLLVTGCDNIAIGKQLHLSPSTIKHHISGLLDKLGVENRIQAAVLAVRRGLLDEHKRGGG